MTALPPMRAPRDDGEILAIPPLDQAGALIDRNRARIADWPTDWPAWARQGRRDLSSEAAMGSRPVLLAGHQPELYHPGVWLKNFALAGLARRHQATAVNLIVDNDAVKSLSLAVPRAVPGGQTRRVELAFAHADPETPWEECVVEDPAAFAAFGARAAEEMRPWGIEPLIATFWPRVCRHLDATGGKVGAAFAAARRDLERSWGCDLVEVPMSRLCATDSFARFVGLLLDDPPRLAAAYNETVQAYRRRHRLRSKNHPVPDLAIDGPWCEVPLWAWRPGGRPLRRGRVFARKQGDRVELRCGDATLGALSPRRPETTLGLLQDQAWKVRTRALTTTLFARLVLGDLFIHGIGGGKYDELTDALVRRLWGIEPPDFLVLTGTHLLPVAVPPASVASVLQNAERRLRDLDWNPQRHLSPSPQADLAERVSQRRHWVEQSPPTPAGRKERFRRLQELTVALRPAVAAQRRSAERVALEARRQQAERELLRRRDYSFCLYPEAGLRAFCTRLL